MTIEKIHKVDKGQWLVIFKGKKTVAIDNNSMEFDVQNIPENQADEYLAMALVAIAGA